MAVNTGNSISRIDPVPAYLLQSLSANPVVSQQAALVTSHAEVINQQSAGGRGLSSWVEGAGERLEDAGYIAVQVNSLAGYCAHEFGLVGGERRQAGDAFGILNLWDQGASVMSMSKLKGMLAYEFVAELAMHKGD